MNLRTTRRAGMCTHKNTRAASRLHTQTHVGVIFHSGAPPLIQTHTHTYTLSEEARWNHSVGCWPFTLWRLDFSLFVLLRLSFFPLFPLHLPPLLLHCLIFVNASSPAFHLFCSFWPFYLLSNRRPFHLTNNAWQRSIVLSGLLNSWCFFRRLFLTQGLMEGQDLSHCNFGERNLLL